jgi:hypothetical protein
MKMGWFAMAALPLLAATGAPGQDPSAQETTAPKGKLVRVNDGRKGDEKFDKDAWRKRLASQDLEERERAFGEIAALARHNDEARKAIEEWSKSTSDGDLAWTSRLLLRDLDRMPWRNLRSHDPFGGGMGMDFDFDDFARRFDDLDSMFGDLRSQWDDMLHSLPAPSGGSKSTSRSMSLQVGPNGVTCDVTEKEDGKDPQTKHYTAGSIDELLQAHPELGDQLGGGAQFRMFGGVPHGNFQVFPRNGTGPRILQFGTPDRADEDGEPPTDRLGIYCSEVAKDRASALGLDAGVGLTVESVQPGTIASLLGLRHGDVVIEVNGATVHGADDVKKALKDRAANADVSVVVAGGDGHKRTLNWRPKAEGAKDSKTSGARNL